MMKKAEAEKGSTARISAACGILAALALGAAAPGGSYAEKGKEAPAKPKVAFRKPAAKDLGIGREAIYEVYFHGPAYRVIERAAVEGDGVVALMAAGLPPNAKPAGAGELVAPRLLELCFQAAGLWLLAKRETMALPTSFERAAVCHPEDAAGERRLYATVEVRGDGEAFDARVVDDKGFVHAELLGYRTVALPERRTLRV